MKHFILRSFALPVLLLMLLIPTAWAQTIAPFVGTYVGEAEFTYAGERVRRDMSVTVVPDGKGFVVGWTSVTRQPGQRGKSKSYRISFTPTTRAGIFGSAMKTNMFGKEVPLDPLQGEPFVWARIEGETLTVFSLYINEEGGYEMQEYHRTLVDGGMNLVFRWVKDGTARKEISAFLARKN